MKCVRKFLCAAMAGLCMTAVAGAAEGIGDLSPQGAKAYLDLLNAAEKQYGAARLVDDSAWEGLFLAKLIDFDGDRIPELYYVARVKNEDLIQHVYTFQDGEVLQLKKPKNVSNFIAGLSLSTLLYIGEDKAYLVNGSLMDGDPTTYFTKQGNDLICAFECTILYEESPTVNGKPVSLEELKSQENALLQGMTEVRYYFGGFKGNNGLLKVAMTETRNKLKNRVYVQADPSTDKLTIDGKPVQMPVYKIDGNNYYMLRGLAYALSGTNAQFDVGWDAKQRQITLTKGKAYTPVGGENDNFELYRKTATPTDASIYFNNKPLKLTVYNINDNNFFKLRDLAQALDFGVEWDEKSHTVRINANRSYNNQSDAT